MSDSSEEENEFTEEDAVPHEDTNGGTLEKRRIKSHSVSYKENHVEEENGDQDGEAMDGADEEAPDDNKDSDEESDTDDSEDSDDDDVPLASLAPKKPKPTTTTKNKKPEPGSKKRKAAASTKKQPGPKKNAAATSSSNSSKSYEYASAALYGTECDKGLLIQRLLCRWWYAYTWPTNIPDKAPEGYDPLEGFPGVFVCTADGSSDVGKILDKRDAAAAPSFRNFATKTVDELREMLLRALTEQIKQLGENDPVTRKQLTDMQKWAKTINASKAEKHAIKVLKAHSLYQS